MWFFNPKNVTISPGIDQNQKWLIGQNLPFFNEISLQPTKILNSDVKWAFSDSRVKRWQFFVLINARANGYIFRVNKSQISLRSAFLRQPLHLFLAILKQVQFCLQKKDLITLLRSVMLISVFVKFLTLPISLFSVLINVNKSFLVSLLYTFPLFLFWYCSYFVKSNFIE